MRIRTVFIFTETLGEGKFLLIFGHVPQPARLHWGWSCSAKFRCAILHTTSNNDMLMAWANMGFCTPHKSPLHPRDATCSINIPPIPGALNKGNIVP